MPLALLSMSMTGWRIPRKISWLRTSVSNAFPFDRAWRAHPVPGVNASVFDHVPTGNPKVLQGEANEEVVEHPYGDLGKTKNSYVIRSKVRVPRTRPRPIAEIYIGCRTESGSRRWRHYPSLRQSELPNLHHNRFVCGDNQAWRCVFA